MNLNLMATLYYGGYGIVGYHIFAALAERGVRLSLFPMADAFVPWANRQLVKTAVQNAALYDIDAPCLKICQPIFLAARVGRGEYLGYTFFELDPLPPASVHHLRSVDRALVPSQWAKEVCERSGVRVPISVVPCGIDPKVFYPASERATAGEPCVFLNVGKWEVRKGHDVLLQAFNATFTPADHVELWLMPNYGAVKPEVKERWHRLALESPLGRAGKIKILDPVDMHFDLAEIMRKATCGVFPSRAEGWNLNLLEMMACGKPVIATNYSAHTEYCTAQNALLIESSRLEPANDGVWFDGTHGNWLAWDQAQTEQLCAHLNSVYQQQRAGHALHNAAGVATAARLTWDATAAAIIALAQS